jgi:hypothetical protein
MTMSKTAEQIYLLGGEPRQKFHFRSPVSKLRKRAEIARAIADSSNRSGVWIATKTEATDELLREAISRGLHRNRLGRLLLLHPLRLGSLPALEELFAPVAWGTASFRLLPYEELAEVLSAGNRHELFVGGFVDRDTNTLILYRGDFERVAVPVSIFKPSGSGPRPNLSSLAVTDYGQTVCLGSYEAASDAILYETDPEFRRRLNAKRRLEEKSFGASLRRLRVLKRLRQRDFNSIPAKTIARIERGEVGKPHLSTLKKIAMHLGVPPEEIETF